MRLNDQLQNQDIKRLSCDLNSYDAALGIGKVKALKNLIFILKYYLIVMLYQNKLLLCMRL